MVLEETAEIAAPPEAVAAFLLTLEDNYLAWHPDHIAFRWLGPVAEGRFAFRERIGRWTIGLSMQMAVAPDGRSAICRPLGRPVSWFFPSMTFAAEPRPGGCRYVHRIHLRLGPLRPILERSLLTPLRRHMREETANLARIVGGG